MYRGRRVSTSILPNIEESSERTPIAVCAAEPTPFAEPMPAKTVATVAARMAKIIPFINFYLRIDCLFLFFYFEIFAAGGEGLKEPAAALVEFAEHFHILETHRMHI